MISKNLLKRSFVTELEHRLKEESPLIQVVLGPRQVGKTTGVQMLSGFGKSIYYATADDALSVTSEWITEQWQAAKFAHDSPVLVIDEIQKVMNWSEKIKFLWDAEKKKKGDFRLVLLGSSSLSLSRGLEESLTGRFEVIPVHHWNFDESRRQFGFDLDTYLIFGGYPEASRYIRDYRRWKSYLRNSIIETVVGKDILRQVTVKKPALFRQTFELLASYPAQEISYNKLLGQLQDQGNVEVVKHYIELFEGAFLFKTLQKYSGSEVRSRASSPKIVPLCPSLYSFKHGDKDLLDPSTRGRIFEAAVGAELAKLPGSLYYWRDTSNNEVDYVYQNDRTTVAIEVKSGRTRGAKGMSAFRAQYPKAKPIFINTENFGDFSKDAEGFIRKVVD